MRAILFIIFNFYLFLSIVNGEVFTVNSVQSWNEGMFDNCTVFSQTNKIVLKLSSPGWWNVNYKYRRKLIFQNNLSQDLTNFQLVLTNQLPDLINQLKSEGKLRVGSDDLRFIDEDGNVLNYWLYPSGTNVQQIWIKIKKFSANSSSSIYMYYDNPSAYKFSSYDLTMSKTGVKDGLSALWHFDEGSGTITYDASTNKIGLTFVNNILWNGSDGGTWNGQNIFFTNGDSLVFDGSSSYLKSITDIEGLDGTKESTIIVWFKFNNLPASGSGMTLITKRTNGGPWSYRKISIWNSSGNIWCNYYESTNKNVTAFQLITYNTNFEVNKWYQLAAVFDAPNGRARLYINGKLASETSLPTSATIPHTYGKLIVGANDTTPTQVFDGVMDEIAIYNKALSYDEILANYKREKYISSPPSLLAIGEETPFSTTSLFSNGVYLSKVFDSNNESGMWINSITVNGKITNYTFVELYPMCGDSKELISSENNMINISYDGYFTNTYSSFNDSVEGGRYFQFKIKLNGNGITTPEINSVKINYTLIKDNVSAIIPSSLVTNINLYHIQLTIPGVDEALKVIIEKKEESSFIPISEPYDLFSVYDVKLYYYPSLNIVDSLNDKLGLMFRLKATDYQYIDNTSISIDKALNILKIAYWNGNRWCLLNTTVTKNENVIYLKSYIDMSGIYGVVDVENMENINSSIEIINRIFNPYSDNINLQKVKFIISTESSSMIELSIFDIDGHLIYRRKKYNISELEWNGRAQNNDKIVQKGVYFYEIKKDGTIIKRGTIFVIK